MHFAIYSCYVQSVCVIMHAPLLCVYIMCIVYNSSQPQVQSQSHTMGNCTCMTQIKHTIQAVCTYSGTPLIRTPLLQYFDTFCCPKCHVSVRIRERFHCISLCVYIRTFLQPHRNLYWLFMSRDQQQSHRSTVTWRFVDALEIWFSYGKIVCVHT